MHSWWKTQDFGKIESGLNYTTAAHAFVKATLRLGLWAPLITRNDEPQASDLRWLKTVSSTFQDLDFDVSL